MDFGRLSTFDERLSLSPWRLCRTQHVLILVQPKCWSSVILVAVGVESLCYPIHKEVVQKQVKQLWYVMLDGLNGQKTFVVPYARCVHVNSFAYTHSWLWPLSWSNVSMRYRYSLYHTGYRAEHSRPMSERRGDEENTLKMLNTALCCKLCV